MGLKDLVCIYKLVVTDWVQVLRLLPAVEAGSKLRNEVRAELFPQDELLQSRCFEVGSWDDLIVSTYYPPHRQREEAVSGSLKHKDSL